MVDVERVLDEAGLTNTYVREYVAHWAGVTGAERVEVVSASDDARLVAGVARRGRAAARRRGPLLLAVLLQGHRPRRGAHHRRHERRGRQGHLQQLAPGRGDEAAARRPDDRRVRRQDDVRHPLPDGASGLPAGEVRRGCGAHRQPQRRTPDDPDGTGRRGVHQRPRRLLRQGRPRHRRPREPRPGHARRQALLRDRRRRAHDPALRLVVRRQRAARQDRPRSAPGLLRRLEERLPRRAVHAARHHRQGDRQEVQHLRWLPERLGQDQPRDDAGSRRPRRPLLRRVLRRRHRVAVGRRRRQALRDEPGERRLRCRQGHQREDQPDRDRVDRPGHRRDLHQRRLQREDPAGLVGGSRRQADRPRWLARLEGRPDRRPRARGRRRPVGAPEQPVHHHPGQRPERREGLRGPGRRRDPRHHLRWPHPRPRAADPRDRRHRRGRLRRPHPGRRGDRRRRRSRGRAPLRPDVDAPVHVLPRGRLRRGTGSR